MMSTKEQLIRQILSCNFNIKDKPEETIKTIVDFIMDKINDKDLYVDTIVRMYCAMADYIASNNVAETTLDYYEHEDFIDNYGYFLLEDGSAVKGRLKRQLSKYLYINDYTNDSLFDNRIKDKTLDEILDWLRDNYYEYIETYHSYYVGSYSIDSIGFGEQSEQVSGIYNHLTELEIDPNFMLDAFEDKGFYIPNNKSDFVYYDLSDCGVQINLESFIDEWIDQLIEEYNLNSK